MKLKLRKKHKRLLISLLLTLALGLFGYTLTDEGTIEELPVPVPAGTYRVVSVVDGDTITVEANNTTERVRFVGVDTPEVNDPREPVQCFAEAASQFTNELIGDQPVRLELDPISSDRDRYDRLLRYVYLPDDRLVQAEIIKHGYGFAYTTFPFTKTDEFLRLQNHAREENRGLWSQCDPRPNYYGGFDSDPR
ncbi:MAG: thermonuclease family protein [Candidatus Saccharibacteria bacterium]|nr:thermonuclease family protein [Candidatus Saccharibacteria bacterium]